MLKKIGNTILDIVFFAVIVFAIILIMLSVNSNNDGVSTLFGYSIFNIQNKSMEPTMMIGDLIFVKQTDTSTLQKDDVISFFSLDKNEKVVKTHRIVEIKKDDITTYYVTKGDATLDNDDIEITQSDIIGKWTGRRVSKLGGVYDFLNSKYGFLLCIILPLFVFFIYQVCNFIKVLSDAKNNNKKID